jgi:beta-glucosidase
VTEPDRAIPAYRDASLPVSARVDDLVSRMTLREKVGQLNQRLLGWRCWRRSGAGVTTTELLDREVERWGGLGGLYGVLRADAWSGQDWSNGADPASSAEVTALVQERVLAASRLGIPALFVEEASHGHLALGSTMLPVGLAMAATWRPELVEEAAALIGREVRARGAHLVLMSGIDLLHDPRWGRAEETLGEDPLLASLLVRALVRGLRREPGLAVVLKHFAGQGAGIGGRNGSSAPIGPRELAELHLPMARAGIEEGALGLMAAYNDIDGVPCVADERLLTRLLRDRWGFEGVVMADLGAIDRLTRSGVSLVAAGASALRAGVDLSLCDESYALLEQALDEGLAEEADVDRAVRRVLGLKVRLGLLDAPAPARPGGPALVAEPARATPPPTTMDDDLAAASLTLLQDRRGALPLDRSPERIAVIGPNADDVGCLLGDYVPPLPPGVGDSVLDAIRARATGTVVHEPGAGRMSPTDGGLARAAAVASDADLVVLVLGSTSARAYDDDFQANGAGRLGDRVPAATGGEGFDMAEVELAAAQRALVAVVADAAPAGVPVIAVVVTGRPLGLAAVADRCDVVLLAWYPGPDGGRAIAEAILGVREPTGRLPVSLPRGSGTLPVAYHERLEVTLRYVDAEARAPFPFGAGLGHGRWRLGRATASASATDVAGLAGLTVEVPVANEGHRAGTTVVQLYARFLTPGLVPRRAVLVGFQRVRLAPGSTTEVRVSMLADALPGLGIHALPPEDDAPSGRGGVLELWCALDGATRSEDQVARVEVRGVVSGALSAP